MKIILVICGMLVAIGGAWLSWNNRDLYIQAALYSEGYTLSATPRLRVEEFYGQYAAFPQDNEQAGLTAPHTLYGTGVKHISVIRDGVIVVQFNQEFGDSTMVFTPALDMDSAVLAWRCASDSIERAVLEKLRPSCVYTPATRESELMQGIANQDLQLIRKKIDGKIDLEALINGNTPLMLAANIGNAEVVNLLLDAGANVDHVQVNTERRTPLMIALSRDKAEVASLLLSQGASIERKDYRKQTAVDYARITDARNGDERYELMLMAQANPMFAGRNTELEPLVTPAQRRQDDRQLYQRLKFAIGSCYVRELETLLTRNGDYRTDETIDGKPLRALSGQRDCSTKLTTYLQGKPTWQQVTYSALQLAVDECAINTGKTLLLDNPKLDLLDPHLGESIIFRTVRSGCTEGLNVLLRHPTVIRPLQSELLTAAIREVPQHSLLRTVSILIEEGAELNKTDSKGISPLVAAISHEQPVVAKYLLDAGARVDMRTALGSYPLIEATKKGYHHLVGNLIDNGADVNRQDALGRTALHAAVAKGRRRTVELLLQAGADPRIRDNNGIDSILMAESKRFESIEAVLLAENQD